MLPSVSVILPTYKAVNYVGTQVQALLRQCYGGPLQIVVSVNGPDDGTVALIHSLASQAPGGVSLACIDSSAVAGVTAARNAGALAASGDLFLFCDDDDVVRSGWIRALVERAHSADAVGGQIVINQGRGVAGRSRPVIDGSQRTSHDFLPFAIGCNFAIWRDVFESVGGFDLRMRHGGEDVDICWRIQQAGYELAYAPDAIVDYTYKATFRAAMRQAYKYGESDVLVYALHREDGVPARRPLAAAKTVAFLARDLIPAVRSGRGVYWLTRIAKLAGRFVASLRLRTWYV